jgi:PadR family transcriptional regulator, regulatory protein PadR
MLDDHTIEACADKSLQKVMELIVQLTSLEETILTALTGKKLYGLQIIDAFYEASEGKRTISLGTLYPVLARLEKQGLITSTEVKGSTLSKGGAKRKFYMISPTGLQALSETQHFRNELHRWKPGYGNEAYV